MVNKYRLTNGMGKYFSLIVLSILLIIVIFPMIIVSLNAFKTEAEVNTNGPMSLPQSFNLDTLIYVWHDHQLSQAADEQHHHRRLGCFDRCRNFAAECFCAGDRKIQRQNDRAFVLYAGHDPAERSPGLSAVLFLQTHPPVRQPPVGHPDRRGRFRLPLAPICSLRYSALSTGKCSKRP